MELFSLWLNNTLKTYSVRSNCLLGSIFYTTHEKIYNCENFWRKSLLLTIERSFFEIRNYAMDWRHQQRRIFKFASVKSIKTAAFSFVFISNIVVKTYRKWKIKNVVLDVRTAAHLEAFWFKQDVLFLHVSNVLGVCRGVHVRSPRLVCRSLEVV